MSLYREARAYERENQEGKEIWLGRLSLARRDLEAGSIRAIKSAIGVALLGGLLMRLQRELLRGRIQIWTKRGLRQKISGHELEMGADNVGERVGERYRCSCGSYPLSDSLFCRECGKKVPATVPPIDKTKPLELEILCLKNEIEVLERRAIEASRNKESLELEILDLKKKANAASQKKDLGKLAYHELEALYEKTLIERETWKQAEEEAEAKVQSLSVQLKEQIADNDAANTQLHKRSMEVEVLAAKILKHSDEYSAFDSKMIDARVEQDRLMDENGSLLAQIEELRDENKTNQTVNQALSDVRVELRAAQADQESDVLTISKLRASAAVLNNEISEAKAELDSTRTALFQLELREQDLTRSLQLLHAQPRKDHPAIEALKVLEKYPPFQETDYKASLVPLERDLVSAGRAVLSLRDEIKMKLEDKSDELALLQSQIEMIKKFILECGVSLDDHEGSIQAMSWARNLDQLGAIEGGEEEGSSHVIFQRALGPAEGSREHVVALEEEKKLGHLHQESIYSCAVESHLALIQSLLIPESYLQRVDMMALKGEIAVDMHNAEETLRALLARKEELQILACHSSSRFRELAYKLSAVWEHLNTDGEKREAFIRNFFVGLVNQHYHEATEDNLPLEWVVATHETELQRLGMRLEVSPPRSEDPEGDEIEGLIRAYEGLSLELNAPDWTRRLTKQERKEQEMILIRIRIVNHQPYTYP